MTSPIPPDRRVIDTGRTQGDGFRTRLRDQPSFSRPGPVATQEPGPGRGTGSLLGGGRGIGGAGEPHGGSGAGGRGPLAGGPGSGWAADPRTPGSRGGPTPEGWPGARPGERGVGTGYGPMMGGAGAMRDGQDHRNRYVVPTGEVFDVRIEATEAVLGAEEDDRR